MDIRAADTVISFTVTFTLAITLDTATRAEMTDFFVFVFGVSYDHCCYFLLSADATDGVAATLAVV